MFCPERGNVQKYVSLWKEINCSNVNMPIFMNWCHSTSGLLGKKVDRQKVVKNDNVQIAQKE